MSPSSCPAADDPQLVGDPVDTQSGALVDRTLDFRLVGPIELRWYRHYDSSQHQRACSLGWGHAHEFDRRLRADARSLTLEEPVGRHLVFPRLAADGEQVALGGVTLRRLSLRKYVVIRHAQPVMGFDFTPGQAVARLTRLFQDAHCVRFEHDARLRLTRIVDSAGRSIRVEEDDQGRLLSLTLEAGSDPSAASRDLLLMAYRYDARGNLVATRNADDVGHSFEYDAANRMVRRRGRKGFRFKFSYDAQGRCRLAMGDERLYGVALEYLVPGRLTRVTRPDRGVWSYGFDRNGGLTEITDPAGGVQKYVRDDQGRVVLEWDPNRNPTQILHDPAGAAVARVNVLGHRVALPEDANEADPMLEAVAGHPLEYEYGRLVDADRVRLPGTADLQALALPEAVRALVTTRPDAAPDSRPAAGEELPYPVRPLAAQWWPAPSQGRRFTALGKLVEQHDEFGRRRTWGYDASGNMDRHVDFDGSAWAFDNGTWHFRHGLTDPLGGQTRFTFAPNGRVASCTDALGGRSEYVHDTRDHLVEVRRHGVVRDRYTRDAAGNLVAKHAGDGRLLMRLEIGPGNLPLRRVLASGDEHVLEYDKAGRTLVAATSQDRVQCAYDVIGNRTADLRNGRGVECTFQGWRRPRQVKLLGRFEVRYEWSGSTLTIIDPAGQSHRVLLHDHGLVQRRFGNGSVEWSQYDNLGRCLFKCTQRRDGRLWSRRYHWSGEGELRRVEDGVHGETRHDYDAAHRLKARRRGPHVESFELDAAGNLVAQPGLDGVSLLEGNRLRTAGGEAFDYDDRNHVRVRQRDGATRRFHHDSRDQLVQVDLPGGRWEARYDALGRRSAKTWSGGRTEYWWYGDQLAAELRPDGRLRLYVYADPMAQVPLLVLDYASVDADPSSGTRYLIFTDQLGTPRLLEDDAGGTAWSAEVAPYGEARVAADATTECQLRFPGHWFDPELGLHYNRFRYYDPRLGRYLQSDPWGISGGFNLYAYPANPLLRADVRGLGEENNQNCKKKSDEEGDGQNAAPAPRRMTDAELQSAADHIRMGNGDYNPRDYHTITVTEGMHNGRPVYTVTSSRGPLTERERNRAAEVFGPDVNVPREPPTGPRPNGENHSEQRGMRQTQDQTDRRQATSNITPDTRANRGVLHTGAACPDCGPAQANARNSQGQPNPVENVTGQVEQGGRTNNPNGSEWQRWSRENT